MEFEGSAPTEPSADMRAACHSQREWFVALVAEGFSEPQALTIIGTSMGIMLANSEPPK